MAASRPMLRCLAGSLGCGGAMSLQGEVATFSPELRPVLSWAPTPTARVWGETGMFKRGRLQAALTRCFSMIRKHLVLVS